MIKRPASRRSDLIHMVGMLHSHHRNTHVDCFAPSGLPVNGFFSLLFYTESSTVTSSDEAYLWADNATATTYTPNLAYQWNSKKLTNTMQHVGTGSYQATLSGLTTTGGTVLATGYGSGPERCKVAQWYHATSGLAVNVACFHADGSPADTQFTLSFMSNVLIGGASAWADQPYAQSYTPSQTYQYSSTGSTVTIGRTSLGTYNVSLPSQPPYNKTAAFVTAYGTTPDYCNVGSWVPSNSNQYDTVININCYDRSGSPTDSFYTVQYMTDRPPYLFAKTDISCGSRTVTVSTGNGAGTCTKNTTNGKDDSATCNDGAGNWAVANCSDNNGSGGCRGSSGSGECGIHN